MTAAIVLAAGLSRRMGRFKLTLPWGDRTVIGQIVATLAAEVGEIIVVTGHRADEVAAALAGTSAHLVHNPNHAAGEMLSSIQVGVRAAEARERLKPPPESDEGRSTTAPPAVLLCLGDQPQMEGDTVRAVLAAGAETGYHQIVIPSYRRRAGHPILLPGWLWPEILACSSTLRAVMDAQRAHTHFVAVDTPTVLADLDTPEDYAAEVGS